MVGGECEERETRQVGCVAGSSGSIVMALHPGEKVGSWQRQEEKQQNKGGLQQSSQKQAGHITQFDAVAEPR